MDDEFLADLEELGEQSDIEIDSLLDDLDSPQVDFIAVIQTANDLEYTIEETNKLITDQYMKKFRELCELVPNSYLFAKTVLAIGNKKEISNLKMDWLPNATVMAINLAFSTTPYTEIDMTELENQCNKIFEYHDKQTKLLNLIETKMVEIAPNLSILLGTQVAAKLMGSAGGLMQLVKIPACNILVLGRQKQGSVGLSRVATNQHEGIIFKSDLITNVPKHIRRKAGRLLSAKVALACRLDISHQYKNGEMGNTYREEVQKKIELLIEPPPAKKQKALPLPIEFKKRRGGKRARAQKEKMAPSELQKQQNRLAFGEQEEEIVGVTGEMIGLGMIGSGSGKLKLQHKDFKMPVAKKHKKSQAKISGISSSVAFTPIKGIELENPQVENNTEKQRYFE